MILMGNLIFVGIILVTLQETIKKGEKGGIVISTPMKNYIDMITTFQQKMNDQDQWESLQKKHVVDMDYLQNLTYTGEVIDDHIPHGNGTLTWPNGDKYIGMFKLGLRDGLGKQYCKWMYVGEWKNGNMIGQGTFTYISGKKFIGKITDWINDKLLGDGELWKDGRKIYEGHVENGYFNGKGKRFQSDGSVYEGTFVNSNANGVGIIYHFDGSIYNGTFRNNKETGKGTYTFANKKTKYVSEIEIGPETYSLLINTIKAIHGGGRGTINVNI